MTSGLAWGAKMELPRVLVPEARHLLTLARNDRRAAERDLAALTPER